METRILKCTCKHEFQDERYGKGKRVHNKKKPVAAGISEWECTVCSKRRND